LIWAPGFQIFTYILLEKPYYLMVFCLYPLINLILTHLKSPLIESIRFPILETYIENNENKSWRKSDREVHLGLGLSPILFVITLHWALGRFKLLSPEFTYKAYADDRSFYFKTTWLRTFKKISCQSWLRLIFTLWTQPNAILLYLNYLPLLQQSGIRLCTPPPKKKSGWIRILWIWVKPYRSLDLTLYISQSIRQQIVSTYYRGQEIPLDLKGSTRGRSYKTVTKRPST